MFRRTASLSLSLSLLALSLPAFAAGATVGPGYLLPPMGDRIEVASAHNTHLLVYTDAGSVFGQLLHPDGDRDGSAFLIASSGNYPVVASDGNRFLVVWAHGTEGQQVRATRVSTEGVILDAEPFVVDDEHDTGVDGLPVVIRHFSLSVTWGGSQWLVGWVDTSLDYYATRAARLSPNGDLLEGPIRLTSTTGRPRLASSGTHFIAIIPSSDGGPFVMGLDENADGIAVAGLRDSMATYGESGRQIGGVASDGTDFVVVFEGGYSGEETAGLWAATFSGTTFRETRRRQFSAATDAWASISFVDGRYLVVWDEGSEVRAARMGADLEFIDRSAGFKVTGGQLAGFGDLGESAVVMARENGALVSVPIDFSE